MNGVAVEHYKNRWVNLDHVVRIRWEGGTQHEVFLTMVDGSVVNTQNADFQRQVFNHFGIEPS